jgi:microsomal dipeptidase-like Zn-dependent dipeptidase
MSNLHHLSLTLLLAAVPALVCAQTSSQSGPQNATKTQTPSQRCIAPPWSSIPTPTPRNALWMNTLTWATPCRAATQSGVRRKGNLGAEFFSIWVDPAQYKGQYARRTLELIDSVKQQVARHPKQIEFVATPAGIERAHRNTRFAALMGIEGGHSIENSIPLLRQYYALGVRYMTLTWMNSNDWADSSGDIDDKSVPHTKEGLTEFGKDVVYEMNRLGMMVDISHVSDRTFYRTLNISRAPVIASHSSARALCDAPRNMTDDMLRAVARYGGPNSKGGVVQVNFYSGFLSQAYRDAAKALEPEMNKATQALKDQGQGGRQAGSLRRDREAPAPVRRPHPPPAAFGAHRPHRPHRQGGRRGPRGPGLGFRRHQRPASRGDRLCRRPAQDHRGVDGARLLGRGLPQDSGRQPAARLPRGGAGSQRVASREPA